MGLFGLFKKKKENADSKAKSPETRGDEVKNVEKAQSVSGAASVENAKRTEKPKNESAASAEGAKRAEKPKAENATSAEGVKRVEKPKNESAASAEGVKRAEKPKNESAASTKTKSEAKDAEGKADAKQKAEATVKKSTAAKEEAETEANEKKGAGFSGKFEIKRSRDERYVFNLYAANSVIVATSQVYTSAASAMNGIRSVVENAEKAPIEDQTLKSYEALPYPKWEIYLDKGNQYRFRLNAPNGSCICHSQGYTAKAACKNGIVSIIRTAKNAKIDKSYLKKNQG